MMSTERGIDRRESIWLGILVLALINGFPASIALIVFGNLVGFVITLISTVALVICSGNRVVKYAKLHDATRMSNLGARLKISQAKAWIVIDPNE